jgi:RHS repeat-associated protein
VLFSLSLCLALAIVAGAHPALAAMSKCDVNSSGSTDISDVQAMIAQALGQASPVNDLNNDGAVNVVDVQMVIDAALNLGCAADGGTPPTVTDFNPKSGAIGTLVTASGGNFGAAPQVSMPKLGGGTIALPLSSVTAGSLTFLIPSGAASGQILIDNGAATASTSSPFTVTPSTTFSLAVSPASANLIQGQTVAYAVQLSSANNFDQLAQLSVTGVPAGVTAAFAPPSVAAGQTAVLTLTAPANQAIATANLSITASATVDNLPVAQSGAASLAVVAPTTSLLGRTVVSNPQETPLAGVTVKSLGTDGNGNLTGCTGHTTVADAAGNFALTNLPLLCTGPQLFSFDGTTATAPPGQYAGVNLVFTLTSGQVTASPVLVHLPQISAAETFYVTQNSSVDQSYSFTTIPGLSVTAYAGTTLTMPDGATPKPFPLAAVQVPVDRLPDLKPNVPTMVRVFIVAFQPANATANQPVAVSFPNVSNTAPGTDMPLMTLDPTHGTMVPYGTGAVSADGTQVVPDMDPAHPGHRYGLVHFDWHGQMPSPANQSNPGPNCGCGGGTSQSEGGSPSGGDPVDLASGIQVVDSTDIAIHGGRGPIGISRVYRTMTTNDGPFGLGSQFSYGWELNTGAPNSATAINLIAPDGNQFLFSRQADSSLRNTSVPFLAGMVMTTNASGVTNLRYTDGTVYQFKAFAGLSVLYSITDRNSNTTTFTETPLNASAIRITQIADPVGRTLTLAYDSKAHCTSVTDSIGRQVTYTYNASGAMATMTNAAGGVTGYQYDSQNRLTSLTDARGVVLLQNTYDSNGRVVQQTQADGGVMQFAYTLANPLAATSPIIATTVTDPLGNQTVYRFNIQGYLTDVTDALGQMKSFTRDPGTNQVLHVTGSAQCPVCGPSRQGPMSYTYDSSGNLLTATDALGNTITYTYDPTFNQVTSIRDPLGHTQAFAYDSASNLISVTDENGHVTSFTYNSNGQPLTGTDAVAAQTTVAYDTVGNAIGVTDPLGNVTTNTFDGISRLLTTKDAMGRKTTLAYDALGRLLSISDGRSSTNVFTYDAIGNLLTVTDPRGHATTFTYDGLSRLKTRTDGLGRTETVQYDLAGNPAKFTDRRGQASTFQYDALNRLVTESYADGATVTRSYDPYSRLLSANDSVGGVFSFAYDAVGRLVAQNQPNGTVDYTFDALGRMATRQVGGQAVATYNYDPVSNLLSASMPLAGATFTYDARNLPAQETRTNGVTSAYSYDPVGRVLSLIHSKSGAALNTQTYSYDGSGNRIAASNDISQPLTTQAAAASVDGSNELLTNAQTTYTYDSNGNRLTESGPNGSYTYVWDARNRLASITDGNGNRTSFKYDFLRNLTEIDRTGSGVASQKFVFDIATNVVSLTDASGLPVSVLTGDAIDSHIGSVDSSGTARFGIADPLGTIEATTDSNGNLAASLDYEPYGQTAGSGPAAYPFAFTGRLPVMGSIVYYRKRFYDSATGRFLSEDPLGVAAGDSNFYRYAANNPTELIDPMGLDAFEHGADQGSAFAGLYTATAKAAAGAGFWKNGAGIFKSVTASLDTNLGRAGVIASVIGIGTGYYKDGWPGFFGGIEGTLTGAIVTDLGAFATDALVAAAVAAELPAVVTLVAAGAVLAGTGYLAYKFGNYANCSLTGALKSVFGK